MPLSRAANCLGLPALLVALLALPGFAQEAAAPEPEDPAAVSENAGAYLAARVAAASNDYASAVEWFALALAAEPKNPGLLQGLIAARIGLGDFDAAAVAAKDYLALDQTQSEAATLTLVVTRAGTQDYSGVEKALQGQTVGPLLDDLIRGWAALGQGEMALALAAFDKAAATPGFEGLGLYQKALALASVGDYEGADAILAGKTGKPVNLGRRGVIAHLGILTQLERNADAIKLFDDRFGATTESDLQALRRALEAGAPVPFVLVANARDGIAETLFTMADVLQDQAAAEQVLAYARAAQYLRPTDADMILKSANLLLQIHQPALAAEVFAAVPAEDPAFVQAEIGRADALRQTGDVEGAIAALQALAESHASAIPAHLALGDVLRGADRFDAALQSYDAGIALLPTPSPNWSWPLFYDRAICLERLGRYEESVAAYRATLALSPDQPQVLNNLGYSWIDRGENLDEALAMIERAVAAAPDQGFIIDSQAWAYFRLGRYADALAPMERASLLMPTDPEVTDHLGDVYWVNGRQLEARFQWRRALSFAPAEAAADRIRLKLELGLDAVLSQEKAGQ